MAHAADERPNEPASDAPPEDAPKSGEPADAPDPATPAEPGSAQPGDQPRRRRRRRRRRKPHPEGVAASPPAEACQDGAPAIAASADAPPAQAPSPMQQPRGPGGRGPRRRRPRGDRPREAGPRGERPADARPRDNAPRPERRREDRPREDRPRPQGEARPPGRDARARDGRDARGKGPRGPKARPFGKGRNDFERRPEPKLVTFESVVDRGFEDVADEANGGEVKRVTWTIVKRTVADQRSTKPLSAVYVLKREDVDTEFPNLGAARSAVNKTIAHPEKLTRSKAEYAAAKKK